MEEEEEKEEVEEEMRGAAQNATEGTATYATNVDAEALPITVLMKKVKGTRRGLHVKRGSVWWRCCDRDGHVVPSCYFQMR